ncbi:MAG: glycoside hydrolase [Chromatiales bacterium]|jgi:alpha-amylase/alpha-mannosidase (GH57 family)
MTQKKLNLVLCWHMHQPWYRETLEGDFRLPWVYLHALKDYADMASHLETHPDMRVVVNFTPVLLEQLDDYAQQFASWRKQRSGFSDALLNYLSGKIAIPANEESRVELIRACLRANAAQMIHPYASYRKMVEFITASDGVTINEELTPYLNEQFFLDLLTWYHIAWLGYSIKQDKRIVALIKKGSQFSAKDREQLLEVVTDTMGNLLERYRLLAERDQIELSMTPYAHPIVPLLIDFETMHDSLPEAPAPAYDDYPGGLERARWHMQRGLDVFDQYFKCKPSGVWLSEGAVSEDAVKMLKEFDIKWTASGEGVWHNSTYLSGFNVHDPEARQSLFRCHHLQHDPQPKLFFRDDGLSDLIGFEYQQWDANDATADFLKNLENISVYLEHAPGDHVVSVILDGENAWEYYLDNAFHFLDALYTGLTRSPHLNLLTYQDAVKTCPPAELPKLCAGSWVYGSFSTWIGEADKNRGWELLVEAKQAYDKAVDQLGARQRETATLQLAICEGSDWFWWFGDYNPSDSVSDFDELYRQQLRHLYELLGLKAPKNLDQPLSKGHGNAENAGTMRRGHGN